MSDCTAELPPDEDPDEDFVLVLPWEVAASAVDGLDVDEVDVDDDDLDDPHVDDDPPVDDDVSEAGVDEAGAAEASWRPHGIVSAWPT
jgi:hypothetical protein